MEEVRYKGIKQFTPQQHVQCENQLISFCSSLVAKVYHLRTSLLRTFLSSGEVAPATSYINIYYIIIIIIFYYVSRNIY